MENKKLFDLTIIIILSIWLFAIPTILRPIDQGIIGFPTYYHERIAQDILDSGSLVSYDSLSFGGRPYLYPPAFSLTLAGFAAIFGMYSASVLMMALFGAAAVALTYLIITEMFHDYKASRLAAFLVALIPATIFAFTHLCSRAPPIALGLAAIYLLIKEDNHPFISMILIGISSLFHLETALIFAVLTIPFLKQIWVKTENKNRVIYPVLAAVIIICAFYIPYFVQNGFIEYNAIHNDYRSLSYSMQSSGIQEYFVELSQYANITIIAAFFAIIGFIFAPKMKYVNYVRFWLVFIFTLTLIFERFLIYMPVPLVIMAVLGISVIYNKIPKKVFYVLIAIILVWSVAGAAIKLNTMQNEYPSVEHYKAMTWIKQNTPENSVVVADWSYGHWIAGIAERKNFMDGYAEYAPQANERHAQLQLLYESFTIPILLENESTIYLYAEKWILEKYHSVDDFQEQYLTPYVDEEIYIFQIR